VHVHYTRISFNIEALLHPTQLLSDYRIGGGYPAAGWNLTLAITNNVSYFNSSY